MGAELSLDTLSRLLKLRVAVSGSGAFRARRLPDSGAYQATCQLPGHGTFVRLWDDARGRPAGQMHYADGQPMSTVLDLRDPARFASLMHNADVEIWRGGMADGVPDRIRDLVDLAVASDDEAVIDAAEALYSQGVALEMPDLPVAASLGIPSKWLPPEPVGRWALPETAVPFVEACLAARHPALADAALAVWDVSVGNRPAGRPAVEEGSYGRWRAMVEQWSASPSPSPGMR